MRINALTRSYEQEFTKYGISYKVFGGFRFFERKEIKDALAYLRLIANPFDSEAVSRIINVPRRGIGEKTMEALRAYAEQEELSLYDAVLDCDLLPLGEAVKNKLRAFGKYIKDLVILAQEAPVNELCNTLMETSGMKEMYLDGTDEGAAKRANLDEFLNSVEEFVHLNPEATLSDYLQQITLYSDTDEMDEDDYVTIATIHAVKGLEFRCVFLCGLEENIMPTSRAQDDPAALEEERRLMYVAITRAREKLWLTRSRSRYLYGKREPTVRSEFIDELKDELGIEDIKARYSGDYGDEDFGYGSYGYGAGGGARRSSGYGSYGGYSNSAPRRVGRASDADEGAYRTFGSGRPAVRNGAKSAPPAKKEPVRFGNVGVRPSPSGTGAANTAKAGADLSRFREGARVRHPRFGEGVVTGVRGEGGNLIVTVHFETAGNKDLAAALAPLEVL